MQAGLKFASLLRRGLKDFVPFICFGIYIRIENKFKKFTRNGLIFAWIKFRDFARIFGNFAILNVRKSW